MEKSKISKYKVLLIFGRIQYPLFLLTNFEDIDKYLEIIDKDIESVKQEIQQPESEN